MTQPTNPRRRWFRFSLRTLLIVVLLLSLPLGWFTLKMRQAEKQRKAVEAIIEAGGVVIYDEWRAPDWLRGLTGEDFFADVVGVGVGREMNTDVLLGHVKRMSKLERLGLTDAPVTDAKLEYLRGLTRLRVLGLSNTEVTDAGLTRLRELTDLEDLYLDGTHVTKDGVEELQELLPNCEIHWSNPNRN